MHSQSDPTERLMKQLEFVREIDKAKSVLRRSLLLDRSRRENDAEHSWHLAVMAILLEEHANEPVDLLKVVKMLLIHDLVEIDAGDTYAYDPEGNRDKEERERRAAERIFGLLPEEQAEEFRGLWEEFEARSTPEARFAAAMDRFQPLMFNSFTEGATWKKHGVTREQVIARNRHIEEGSRTLWHHAEALIEESVRKGYLAP